MSRPQHTQQDPQYSILNSHLQSQSRYQSHHQRSAVEGSLKNSIFWYGSWLLGLPIFIYGAADRVLATLITNTTEVTDLCYCVTSIIVLICWLCIGLGERPASLSPEIQAATEIMPQVFNSNCIAQQSYRLPFPHSCQIYHLLNLKHLEDIHRFSLGNLKVIDVSHFCKTQAGGLIRFKTVLDSPFNVLRIWRKPSVDVDLILHSPYQIELKVPAYQNKFIRVLFSVIPLNAKEHQLVIQMFSDLQWSREFQRIILLLASNLTLLEDLPYLSQLATRNIAQSARPSSGAIEPANRPHGMQLFHRYMDLYGHDWQSQQPKLLSGQPT